jgi:hypothetical protein
MEMGLGLAVDGKKEALTTLRHPHDHMAEGGIPDGGDEDLEHGGDYISTTFGGQAKVVEID